MAAVNSVSTGSRLELSSLRPRAVLMCGPVGAEGGGVALQLRGAGEVAVSCQDPALLADLLATLHAAGSGETATATASFDIMDSSPCQDIASSPPLASDCFLTDNSDTLSHSEQDQGSESANSNNNNNVSSNNNNNSNSKFTSSKKIRPKAASPSRQGPQQCQVCNKIFGNASALAKHKLTHSDERKYGCPVCAKAFKRQDHLNGHMLTHRNKKPYECRAEGCGKSYCDARSLRRHAENHHGSSAVSASSSSSSSSPSQANGCIQFAGTGSTNGTVITKESTSSPDSGKGSSPSPTIKTTKVPDSSPVNRSSPGSQSGSSSAATSPLSTKSNSSSSGSSGVSSSSGSHQPGKHSSSSHSSSKHHTSSHVHKSQAGSIQSKGSSGGSGTAGSQSQKAKLGQSGKPNGYQGNSGASPALQQNGQSGQSSPSDQSSQDGNTSPSATKTLNLHKPPRTWNIQAQQNQQRSSNILRGPPLIPPHRPPAEPRPVECNLCHRKFKNVPALNGHMRLHGGYFKKEAESKKLEKKESSGPPLQTASVSVRALIEEKIISRRAAPPVSSSSEPQSPVTPTATTSVTSLTSFVAPAPPVTTSPGTPVSATTAVTQEFLTPIRTPSANQQQKDGTLIELLKRGSKVAVKRSASDPGHQSPGPVLSFQPPDFALSNMSFQQDEGEFFGPTLQADVYHVQDPAILLQQSSDSLQFASTSEQLDDLASLDDYATVTASLQDGSTIQYPVNQQLQAVLDSPLPEGLADFSTYHSAVSDNNSNSKDVLGFQKEYIMYANSPHVGLSAPSPLPSPLKYHDSPSFTYPTPPASHEAQSPSLSQGNVQSLPILSPTTNLHSVETPITSTDVEEVRNTSSPLSAAFFTTTMSSAEEVEEALEEVLPGESIVHGDALDMYGLSDPSPPPQSPICVTPLPSPLPNQQTTVTHAPTNQTFTPSNNLTFQRQHTFQSQMMSNSEDPLLSSSPKDFGHKKKFEFGGYQSYKIISHGPIDVNNPNITGILVEANGEYKLIQAASNQLPMSWLTGATHQIIPKENLSSVQPLKHGVIIKSSQPQMAIQSIPSHEQMQLSINDITTTVKPDNEQMKSSHVIDKFDLIKQQDDIFKSDTPGSPQHGCRKRPRSEASNYCFGNQFQSKLRSCSDDYFTPPPMLDPLRVGPGLYNEVSSSNESIPCIHQDTGSFPSDSNENKKIPRINLGSQFQASIPDLCTEEIKCDRDPNYEHLLWDPGINDTLDDNEVRMFMELAMCAAMPVGGHTKEYALQVLGRCGGDTHAATLQLMASTSLDDNDSEGCEGENQGSHNQRWSPDEVEGFLAGLREHDKNFYRIAKQIGTKSSKQCVQFYYFWKKVTKDYKTLYLRSWSPEGTRDRSSSKGSWRWLNKGGRPPSTPPGTPASESGDEFPCKLCGKVFNKVKSRSAHMKSHRPQDADSKRPRVEKSDSKLSGLEERQHRESPLDNNHSSVQMQQLQ